jgi:predicted permease
MARRWLTLRLRLRSILCRARLDRELDEELRFHLEHMIEEGVARGLSPEEARYAAMRAMGGLEQRKEEMRDMRRVHWWTDFFDDARYAIRTLRRSPGLTAFVALALGLGIGTPSAMYSMLDALIFRPYPVPHPGNVVKLAGTTRDSSLEQFSYREYLDIRGHTGSYDGVIASADLEEVGFSAHAGSVPRVRGGMRVSANYFRVLGVQPRLGRGFRDDEDRVPGRDAVVVLGPDFWKHEFASDPAVLGRTVRLNGREFTVIGVAPETFSGMMIFGHPDFYVPLAMAPLFSADPRKDFFNDRDDRELRVRARLKPGVTIARARSELAALAKNFEREYPKLNRARGAAVYTQFEARRIEDGNWRFGVLFVLLGLALLLVACTNVAGLLLSRARGRRREIAVRLAIGAGRFRLVRLLAAESLILALLGGIVGVAVGYGIVQWMHSQESIIFMTDLPMGVPFRMDTRALVAALALAALSAFLCGLAPALESTRTNLVSGLKSADADLPGRKRLWGRNALVVAQVSTSLMLLTAAFLMARSFGRQVLEGTGFAKDHLLMATFDPHLAQYDAARTTQFYRLLTERVRELPGVRSEALTESVPLDWNGVDSLAFVPDGFQLPRDRENFTSAMDTVGEAYFETMGIPILRGRGFLKSDGAEAPRVAVVNERFAKHYWPGGDALGKRIRVESRTGAPVEIVGIAQTFKYLDTGEKPMDFVYLPLEQHPVSRMVLLVHSSGDPAESLQPVRDIVRGLDPYLPLMHAMSYQDFYQNTAVKGPAIAVKLMSSMGAVGLLLAVSGLYGLVAYNVSRRTREIGIRMALGAASSDVLRLMMGKGLVLVAIGTAIGLAMGFGVEHLMNSMLFDVGGVDVVAYLVVAPSLLVVTILAAYVPARRASRIAPTRALRYE